MIFSRFYNEPYVTTISEYNLPKIVWTYWDTTHQPKLISQIQRYNKFPGWTVIHLNKDNVGEYVNMRETPKNYDKLHIAHQADWIRLALLKRHGGCWIDASIIINDAKAFDQMHEESVQKQSELTAFYYDTHTINKNNTSYIENWFIMAPKDSRIIQLWYEEYTRAIEMGFERYKQLPIRFPLSEYLEGNAYLTQHTCLQVVLNDKLKGKKPNILLYNASDSMFKLQNHCKWNHNCTMYTLQNKIGKKLPYIKLVNADRKTNIDISPFFN